MENIVSARRLRRSATNKNINLNLGDIGISDTYIKKRIKNHDLDIDLDEDKDLNEEYQEKNDKSIKFSYKKKLLVKSFISINIVLLCLICKLMLKDQVLENKYSKYVIDEYQKDYSKEILLDKMETYAKISYEAGKYILPNEITNYMSTYYNQKLKEYIKNFELKQEVLNVFNNTNETIYKNIENDEEITTYKEDINVQNQEDILNNNQNQIISDQGEKSTDNTGVGGGEPYAEAVLEEAKSAISMMDIDVDEILQKEIDIVVPVKGTITSRYGAREQIFNNVNPYHTGIDIANSLNTKIHSATDGVVIKTENMNKFYGNNIEIEKDGVIFKYAHLNKIEVKQGDVVKQNDEIALMGSTGMSTGPHLHFEIKINDRTVDPEKILNFN